MALPRVYSSEMLVSLSIWEISRNPICIRYLVFHCASCDRLSRNPRSGYDFSMEWRGIPVENMVDK